MQTPMNLYKGSVWFDLVPALDDLQETRKHCFHAGWFPTTATIASQEKNSWPLSWKSTFSGGAGLFFCRQEGVQRDLTKLLALQMRVLQSRQSLFCAKKLALFCTSEPGRVGMVRPCRVDGDVWVPIASLSSLFKRKKFKIFPQTCFEVLSNFLFLLDVQQQLSCPSWSHRATVKSFS